jgi:hypothetical protein
LSSVLAAPTNVPLPFILQAAGLTDWFAAGEITTLEQARLFILSFILKASSPMESKANLVRLIQVLLDEPTLARQRTTLNHVLWEISGEAERASRLMYGSYSSEVARTDAIREYLAAHPASLIETFAVPGGILREIVQVHKAAAPVDIDFAVISRTTLGYRVDLVKLESSDANAIDFASLIDIERHLHHFAESLHSNDAYLKLLEMLLDATLRERGDQGRLRAATVGPLSAATPRVAYHVLAGRRDELIAALRHENYEARLASEWGLQTECVSYDRFIDVVRADEVNK